MEKEIQKEKKPAKEEEYENAVMVAYQKRPPGEWERVEIPYKKKKKKG